MLNLFYYKTCQTFTHTGQVHVSSIDMVINMNVYFYIQINVTNLSKPIYVLSLLADPPTHFLKTKIFKG